MKLITSNLLDTVTAQATTSARLRMNYNFHESLEEPLHRLLNAVEPGTYLPPHRHKNPDKVEIYTVLRGRLVTFLFDDAGNITDHIELDPLKGMYGMEIPAGRWHSIVVLESGTVIYEIKLGPYAPLAQDNLAPWAPAAEDTAAVAAYMQGLLDRIKSK